MAQVPRARLISSLPLIAGGAAGLIVAMVAAVLPTALLEAFVDSSGLAAVLPVAAPPLGVTARGVMALGGGVGLAAVVWAALYLLIAPRTPAVKRPSGVQGAPTIRRADAHPDAPPRWPLSARDLPATELPAPPPAPTLAPIEQKLPADLDVPLAVFDPDALPPTPMPPSRPLRSLTPALAPGERLETFTLTPPPPPLPAPAASWRDEPPSIDALLRRLEQGARRKVAGAH